MNRSKLKAMFAKLQRASEQGKLVSPEEYERRKMLNPHIDVGPARMSRHPKFMRIKGMFKS